MNNENNGDTSCTEIVDLNDKEEANKDVHDEEPMVGAKQNHDGGQAQKLKAHEVKSILDEWERLHEEASTNNTNPPSNR